MPDIQRQPKFRRKGRWLIAAAMLLLLPVVAGLALKAVFTPERLREMSVKLMNKFYEVQAEGPVWDMGGDNKK